MINKEGFIVVQKSRVPEEAHFNPRYRGVGRLVPWLIENYSKGFDDPYESAKYASDEGLIHNLPLAQEVLQIFTEIVEPENLEILFIRDRATDLEMKLLAGQGMQFLGFDVAGDGSPFYSLVSDFPPSSEVSFQTFRKQLNENGLFESIDTARNFLQACLERYPEDRDQGIIVWEVYLVLQNAT